MDARRVDLTDVINVGGSYADHLGIAEDVIKQGARFGLIKDQDAKRVIRALAAQGDSPDGRMPLFAADVLAAPAIMENPNEFVNWFNGMKRKEEIERQAGNAIPGMHGHHGNSVSSIHAAGQNLPIRDHYRMINEIDRNPEYKDVDKMGTHREQMKGIMGPGHLTSSFNAHIDPLRENVTNTGYWQTDQSYHDEMDPIKRAALVVEETLRPQQRLSNLAYESPQNQEAISTAAAELGITPDELMNTSLNEKGKTYANVYRDQLRRDGFDASGLVKLLYMDEGKARNDTTSNSGVLDDRPELSDNRRRMGMSGNLTWETGADGALHTYLQSNNRRRRL